VLVAALEPSMPGPRQLLQSAEDTSGQENRETAKVIGVIDFIR